MGRDRWEGVGIDTLTVRRVAFSFPDDIDPAWNPRLPEFSFAADSVSLLMPYAEPYFVRSVRSALPGLDGPLRTETERYLRQEVGHHRQHRRFNDLMAVRYPALRRLERWMERAYGWLGRTRSQRFNLAFAASSETIAFSLARWTETHVRELFDGGDAVVGTLFLWHLAEEVEHKSVAFDVYAAMDGSRKRAALAMAVSFSLLAWFTVLGTLTMLVISRRVFSPLAWIRLLRWAVSLAFTVLPDMAASLLPHHHPTQFTDPVWMGQWLQAFDPATGTMPVWDAA